MTELTKSLGDTVAEKIKESIFSRRLFEPGQQLPKEAELAARFNVSRTALREAIKKLEAENILIIRREWALLFQKISALALIPADFPMKSCKDNS